MAAPTAAGRFGRVPGVLDESSQPLYDTLALVIGTGSYRFFSVQIGGAKTRLSTNMTLAGVLPSPQSYIIHAIRVIVKKATGAIADLVINNSYGVLKVGEKESIVGPTLLFCAGAGLFNNLQTTDRAQNGFPEARSVWALEKPVTIGVNQNFHFDLIYDTAPATGETCDVLVVLDGMQVRGVQ